MTEATVGAIALKKRRDNRRLPGIEVPINKEPELSRALEAMNEHFRMYEGGTNAPKERFVTLAELENSGLITTGVKNKFAFIAQVQGQDVIQPSGTSKGSVINHITNTTVAGGGGATELAGLTDVDAGGTSGDFLYFSGTTWGPRKLFSKSNTWSATQRFNKPFRMLEQAAAPSAVTSYGYLWVKDDTPNTLWFTDDAGVSSTMLRDVDSATITGSWDFSGNVDLITGAVFAIWDTTDTDSVSIWHDGTRLRVDDATLTTDSISITNMGVFLRGGVNLRIEGATSGNVVAIDHDDTDFNITGTNTTDIDIAGFTTIQAGGVNADFDAITATSYGGITEANLVDKSATEDVSGAWTFSGALLKMATGASHTLQVGDDGSGDSNAIEIGKGFNAASYLRWTRAGTADYEFEVDSAERMWLHMDQGNTVTGQQLRITNNGTGSTIFTFDGDSGDFTASLGDISGVTIGGITEANLVDKSAAEVISGEWSVPAVARNKTASYTLVLGDAGQLVRFTGSTASKVCTIPANASVAYPIGTMIAITNDGSVSMTVAITTDTLTWGKTNGTGTRTLAAGADAVILKTTATTWKLNGSALVT